MTSAASIIRSGMPRQSHCTQWLCLFSMVLLVLAGCERAPEPVKLAGRCMGTSWHVTYRVQQGRPGLDRAAVEAQIAQLLERVEQSMSTYRETSEISRFNRMPVGEWFTASPDFLTVMEAALRVGDASAGAYDITVAPLVERWGFGASTGFDAQRLPEAQEITDLLAQVGQGALEVDLPGGRLRKFNQVRVDLSSVAKGYGVDVVADWLLAQGIDNFLVEVGGELRLAGRSHRGDLWRVAIEQPDPGSGGIAEALELGSAAVATSGDYRNFVEIDGQRYSHSIDPRTGYPVVHDLVSVTVVHDNAMLADAWATALIVMGAKNARRVAKEQGLAAYFIRRLDSGLDSSYTDLLEQYLPGR